MSYNGYLSNTLCKHMNSLCEKKILSKCELDKASDTCGVSYELDENKPSIRLATKLFDTLVVSLDYLLEKTKFEIEKLFKKIGAQAILTTDVKKQLNTVKVIPVR